MTAGDQLGALLDAAQALTAGNVAYALIGGIAVGVRAQVPRATNDIDVAVATSVERQRVAELLDEAGFELRGEFAHSLNFPPCKRRAVAGCVRSLLRRDHRACQARRGC